MESNQHKLAYCTEMMARARNDTDRLAGLALLPSLLKDVSPEECPNLFDTLASCVPGEFLQTLLDDSDQPEAAQAALAVLSRLFCSNYALENETYANLAPSIVNSFVRLIEKLEKPNVDDSETAAVRLSAIYSAEDALICISKLATLCKFESVKTFLLTSFSDERSLFYKCFEKYFHLQPSNALGFYCTLLPHFPKNGRSYKSFQNTAAVTLDVINRDAASPQHFQLLELFADRLLNIMSMPLVEFYGAGSADETWSRDFRTLLKGALVSRSLGDKERHVTFKACSALLLFVGRRWLSVDQEFMQILVNMCCVEARLALDVDGNPSAELLASCCTILETSVRMLIDECSDDDDDDVITSSSSSIDTTKLYQMNDIVLEFVKFALSRLVELDKNLTNEEVALDSRTICPLYSMITAYLEEGEELIPKELLQDSKVCLGRLSDVFDKERGGKPPCVSSA